MIYNHQLEGNNEKNKKKLKCFYCHEAVETIFNLIIISFNVKELYLYRRNRRLTGGKINLKTVNRVFCDELLMEKEKQVLYQKGR